MPGLSDEAQLRAAIILADACRAARRQARLAGAPEPGWVAELAGLAESLRDDVTNVERKRRRALNRDAARRYRQRNRAPAA